jgi:hypothetical protein
MDWSNKDKHVQLNFTYSGAFADHLGLRANRQ